MFTLFILLYSPWDLVAQHQQVGRGKEKEGGGGLPFVNGMATTRPLSEHNLSLKKTNWDDWLGYSIN